MQISSLLISSVGAYNDSGIGTGGFILFHENEKIIIDKFDTTGLFKFDNQYFRFIRSKKLLIGYNKSGIFYQCTFPNVYDCHDILLLEDWILFVSTSTNQILFYNYLGQLIKTIDFDGEGDAWHLNCLEKNNGEMFVTAFGKFKKHREWNIKGCAEQGILYNVDQNEVILNKLSGPHTPRFIDGKWHICNSNTNSLRVFSSKNKYTEIPLGGFTRGMCFDDNHIYVGVSADRKSESPTTSKISVLDRNNYNVKDEIEIPFAEIYDLVICSKSTSDHIKLNTSNFLIHSTNKTINSLTKQVEIGHASILKLQNEIDKIKKQNKFKYLKKIIKKLK